MPKYVEDREILPVAGAFGVSMSLAQWIRSHRSDADLYEGTGPYRDALFIHLEEEWGYRDWLWIYFGTVEDLIQDWREGRRPISPRYTPSDYYRRYDPELAYDGELHEITWRPKYCRVRPKELLMDPDVVWTHGVGDHPYLMETGYPMLCIDGRKGFHGSAHVHEGDDTVLNIGYYKLTGLDEVRVEIVPERVLGELSKIA